MANPGARSGNSSRSYPPLLTAEQLSHLTASFTDYALSHGLIVRPAPSFVAQNPHNALATPAPVTLWPSLFPRRPFEEARAIQTACNELYARVAHDEEWLGELTAELARVDDFIAGLWGVHLRVRSGGGYKHKYSLGLFRSDYMLHCDGGEEVSAPLLLQGADERGVEMGIRQVEFNTIASSFGALSTKVAELHRFLWRSGAYPPTDVIADLALPRNPALEHLADGLAKAHELYIADVTASRGSGNPPTTTTLRSPPVAGSTDANANAGSAPPPPPPPGPTEGFGIIFIVQEGERNAFDQRWLEYHLTERYGIRVFRTTLADVRRYSHHLRPNYELLFVPPHALDSRKQQVFEISVVYFRAAYDPADYPTQAEWTARLFLEESRAIKCPTVLTQLAGSKKVQQVLAGPGALDRFVTDPGMQRRIFDTFAAIYPMDGDSEAGREARRLAFEHPERFVLKPQREGGGNNIYREKIPEFLNALEEDKWQGYILMELIQPPEVDNVVVRNGEMVQGKVVGELGVYGAVIWKDGADGGADVVYNQEAGVLLRTKVSSSEEGGVAAGFGAIDSCVLVD